MARLQRRDGYTEAMEVAAILPGEIRVSSDRIMQLLRGVPVLNALNAEELATLARSVRPIQLGPYERIIVQGREGSSLFILAEGSLHVLVRQSDGVDLEVASLERGAAFGEMSLLTGERRSSTVRSLDDALIYEVAQSDFQRVLAGRPGLIDELATLMERRHKESQRSGVSYSAKKEVTRLSERIRSFFFQRD